MPTKATETKRRWNVKTYAQYTISLKRVADADLIARIEAEREKGKSAAEAIKSLIRADIEKEEK